MKYANGRMPAELTTTSPAAQAALGPFTFWAGRRLRSTSAHVRNPRSTAAIDMTALRRAGERSCHRLDFDAITVLLVPRTGRCLPRVVHAGVAEPGYQPASRACFHAGYSVVLVVQPDQPGRHPLDCSTKDRATAPAIGVAAARTILRVMDGLQSAVFHFTRVSPPPASLTWLACACVRRPLESEPRCDRSGRRLPKAIGVDLRAPHP